MTQENSNRVWAVLCLLVIVVVASYWLNTRPGGTTGEKIGSAIDAFASDMKKAADEVRDDDFPKKMGDKLRNTEEKVKRHLDGAAR